MEPCHSDPVWLCMAPSLKTSQLSTRSAQQVFEDHLRLRLQGRLEEDLARNYAADVILLTVNSNDCGHDALRNSARRLRDQLPGAKFELIKKQVRERYALLIWRASSERFDAADGADTFFIQDGLIRLQTIHYRLLLSADY